MEVIVGLGYLLLLLFPFSSCFPQFLQLDINLQSSHNCSSGETTSPSEILELVEAGEEVVESCFWLVERAESEGLQVGEDIFSVECGARVVEAVVVTFFWATLSLWCKT